MSPTLNDGDRLEVLNYGGEAPERGDVVVFRAPTSPDRQFAKRIIGLPGETVTIDESTGVVRVGDQPLSEPYVNGANRCTETCTWTVPEAASPQALDACGSERCYFVLGDSRENSSDSRMGWLVPAENIVGYIAVE